MRLKDRLGRPPLLYRDDGTHGERKRFPIVIRYRRDRWRERVLKETPLLIVQQSGFTDRCCPCPTDPLPRNGVRACVEVLRMAEDLIGQRIQVHHWIVSSTRNSLTIWGE